MSIRQILLVAMLAALAAGLSVFAARVDQLWLVVAALAAAFVGGGALLHVRSGDAIRELAVLREHLETTRQHAALLARHTRELRDAFVHSAQKQFDRASSGQPSPALSFDGLTKTGDFAVLSALVRDIADSVADLDRRSEATESELAELRRQKQGGGRVAPPSAPGWMAPAKLSAPEVSASTQRNGASSRDAGSASARPELRNIPAAADMSRQQEAPRAVRQLVAAAIASDRFDLYLQRVVGLPQRKTRGYDVTLRPDGSDLTIPNAEIRLAVDGVGHQLAFDRKLMIQAVRLARVFEKRERDVVLFVDISQRYLMSEAAFDELEALIADAPLAPQRIILCLPQRFFKKAVAFEHEALRNLSELGFRFQMRDVEDLNFDLARLSQIGVRWIRVESQRFIETVQNQDTLMDVAVADFVTLLNRRKISLIAENINDEHSVAELIDVNVEFAHGGVFAPPQAVRPDALDLTTITDSPVEVTRGPEPPQPERRGLRDLARRA